MNRWDDRDYRHISEAHLAGSRFHVGFKDGANVVIPLSKVIGRAGNRPVNVHEIRDFVIVLSVGGKLIEVPWLVFRRLTDRGFARHLANIDKQQHEKVGAHLKCLRAARGLMAKDIAHEAGITPQSLSRIEAGKHDVSFSTLERILRALGCTLKELAERCTQSDNTTDGDLDVDPLDVNTGIRHLHEIGFTTRFIRRRLLCSDDKAAGSRVSVFLGAMYSGIPHNRTCLAMLKTPLNASQKKVHAYKFYANRLAEWALEASPACQTRLPADPIKIHNHVIRSYGTANFKTLLEYVWKCGIPVIPLSDSGGFHGACWRIGKRNAIVLKQRTISHSRWMFDLAHEVAHATLHLGTRDSCVVDFDEPAMNTQKQIEEEANHFASTLLLGGRQDDLLQAVDEMAGGELAYYKRAVMDVSLQYTVPVDILASFVAFQLAKRKINWWGACQTLQTTEPHPFMVARKKFMASIDLSRLSTEKRDIINAAIAYGTSTAAARYQTA